MTKPYILGLTGGIACGKTTVAALLVKLGARQADADAISRSLTAPGGPALDSIREVFGDGVFNSDGTLDRRALGSVIFHDAAQKRALEAIIHPMVQHEMMEIADEAGRDGVKVCVFNVPLLYETAMDALCDSVWVVSLPRDKQIIRLMNRDGLSRADAEARIDNQMPSEEKEARASYVFRTDKPEADTLREVEKRYNELLRAIK